MKKRTYVYILLGVILMTSLACNVGGTTPTGSGQEAPPPENGLTQESVEAPSTQEAETGNDGSPGPETIDLTNAALYSVTDAPAFKIAVTIKYTGVDTAGAAKELSMNMSLEKQNQPQDMQRFLMTGFPSEETMETVIIGDQLYNVFPGMGCLVFPASTQEKSPAEFIPNLQKDVTGQAQLVESGVEINGFVTDKYELSGENMVNSGDADNELASAFAYVVRDGGFITLFEAQGKLKTESLGDFDPNQPTGFVTTQSYVPIEDGSLNISIPAGCEHQAGMAGEFPVMEGATGLTTTPEQVFFQIEKPLPEVLDYYRAEVPGLGWTLTDDTVMGSFSTLVFTKDGKNVEVNALGNGDTSTSVTIKER